MKAILPVFLEETGCISDLTHAKAGLLKYPVSSQVDILCTLENEDKA
jgi:hypothetical protein